MHGWSETGFFSEKTRYSPQKRQKTKVVKVFMRLGLFDSEVGEVWEILSLFSNVLFWKMQYLCINGNLASFAIINYDANLNKLV